MRIKDMLSAFEETAPFSLQEEYDNSGLQLGHPDKEISKALICLDVSPAIVEEAIRESCDVIVSHHPVIFKGLKKISGTSYTEKVIIEAIRHDIGIVSVHTNLDNVQRGVNRELAQRIGLVGMRILSPRSGLLKKLVTFCPTAQANAVRMALFEAGAGRIGDYDCCSYNIEGHGTFRAGDTAKPFVGNLNELHTEPEVRIETIFPAYLEESVIAALHKSHPYEEVAFDIYSLDNSFENAGSGIYGELPDPMTETDFLGMLKNVLQIPVLRHSPFRGKMISKVALCGGSGSFLAPRAIHAGADAFVTAEVKYNQFMDAMQYLLMVDAGHYETEQFTKELLAGIIQKKFINFAVLISQVNTNPVHYY